MRVAWIPRQQFVKDHFDYHPGEHVQVISPTGAGKTHLLGQLAENVLPRFPELRYVSLMPKPMDDTTNYWAGRLNLKETEIWPPRKPWGSDARGHVFWPKHIRDDEAANKAHLNQKFSKVLTDLYWEGNSITFVDDAYLIGVHYGLNDELDRHWIAGRSNKAGLWTSLQKPSGTKGGSISSFAYDSPTHMFFGRDNDDRNLQRIAEIAISQLNPKEVMSLIQNLPVHKYGNSAVSEMLYINRSGPFLAQVGV